MNPATWPNLIVSVYTLGLGLFVLYSNPHARRNRLCFFLTFFTFFWLFCYGLMYSMRDYGAAKILSKIGHISAVIISPIVYSFTLEVLGLYKRKTDIRILNVAKYLAIIASVLTLSPSPLYYKALIKHPWGYYPLGGPLMIAYALWTFGIAMRSIYLIFQASKKARTELDFNEYQRFKYYLVSIAIFVIAAMDYLPKFGLEIYPFGYVFVFGFASLTTYATVRHQLFDINVIIRRSFIYSTLIAAITFIYLAAILISEHVFRSYLGYRSLIVAIVASVLIAIVFNPIRTKVQNFIDKFFFKIDAEKLMHENLQMKSELEKTDRLKAIATLAAGMAHEIKNPLTAIKTFAEYLPSRYGDPDFREKFGRIVADEVDRVNNIVAQLLEFSKPKELELSKISVAAALDETLGLLNRNFVTSKIDVGKNYADRVEIEADKNQLKQAFLNIFLNSIQAMPNGGTIAVETAASSGEYLISISDTGLGIEASKLPHIFDPFFTTKQDGTGLGLSIVHGIIAKHGGKIQVKSELGRGTRFEIRFPMKRR